jgi:hypothetical protein
VVSSGAVLPAGIPPRVKEAILSAEIGEAGVVRSLRDRPPRRLLNKLEASVGNFAPGGGDGFPRRIKWRRIAGPVVSPAQMTDYVKTEEDLRLRNPRQPTTELVGRKQSADDGQIKHSDWVSRLPSDHATLPDLTIPDFLMRTA